MPRATAHNRIWVIAYDVVDARRRRRVARLLEGEALRIQKSVFSTECSQDQLAAVVRRVRQELATADRLHAYPVLQRNGLPLPWARAAATARLPAFWMV
jgi:CRISPR-associated protein Cas2